MADDKQQTAEERRVAFVEERAHRDSESANEHWRAAASAVMLINGGAASAILGFFGMAAKQASQSTPSHLVIHFSVDMFARVALGCYAIGVIAGAAMLFFVSQAVQEFVVRWERERYGPIAGERWTSRDKNEPKHWGTWAWILLRLCGNTYFPDPSSLTETAFNKAICWQCWARLAFWFSLLAFLKGTLILAFCAR